eukprot:CAMPEP_0181093240 /NCGR_PEP_ID=MMETSP1071-20121207/9341_1 /TAXON_ID=35127 /ORGANISM="Thalassiosira sp., Strain NH16" /LENGTH=39 /DNA_ID= /DNA_START= /DNA_END= /DNA_ORIENTATION=
MSLSAVGRVWRRRTDCTGCGRPATAKGRAMQEDVKGEGL